MRYYLDGYNLLFSLSNSRLPLLKQRKEMIQFLQLAFEKKKLTGTIVFDGKVHLNEESGRSYPSPLEIVYTTKGQTADAYILEQMEFCKYRSEITVVTADLGLRRHLQSMRVKVMDNQKFMHFLCKGKKEEEKTDIEESQKEIARLLKIFEQS
ncbi:MAG TPA: NYN domain-containing protein [Chlamydiales bacterium]|nr:NYN domain-containing protein [Chlamydiales bacterium]